MQLHHSLDPAVAPAGSSRGHDVVAGVKAMLPWLTGIVPFGLVIGVRAAQADIPTFAGWLTGPLLFGGSAQIAVIDLLDAGAAPAVVIAAALAINLRFVLYSATMAPHWRGMPRWWQALAAAVLVDPSVAVGVDGYERAADRRRGHLHYLGGAGVLWVAWVTAIAVGATAGARLPDGAASRARHPPLPRRRGRRPAHDPSRSPRRRHRRVSSVRSSVGSAAPRADARDRRRRGRGVRADRRSDR